MKNIFTLFFLCGLLAATAQNPFSFTNANSKFTSAAFHSGNSVSVVDMDGDGMDDIARLSQGTDAYYTIQRTGQTFNNIHAVSTGLGAAWAMVVGDIDNNGVRDIAVGSGSAARTIKANTALTTFTLSGSLPAPGTFFPQNMNFSDIDNDGAIDLFICNDDAAGVFWKNVSGAYPAMTSFFSVANPGTDNSGNYGSIFTDIDNDGDIDFYIAHCRQTTGPTDARRLDQLFINNGDGTYTLDATLAPGGRGLRNYHMTWTASFEDIDNDGDLDCLLTETDVASEIFLNNGNGYFTDITSSSGFSINITPYQSKMEDLDNDGYVDIIISGDDSRVFRNNHNNTFTQVNNLFDGNQMLSFATGDLNHDGKIDLYSSYGSVYNSPTSTDDVLWLNTTNNGNHFVTFDLQGTISNRDALGARVEIYGAWGKQVREVRAGESYGTTNSFMCHFGLGTATTIDSAIVRWPRSLVTRLYNRPADQFIKVIEGQCSSPDNIISFNGPSVICGGQSVTMSAPTGYSYLWNTGATTQTLTTSTTGDFTVKVTDTNTGCSSTSPMVTVLASPNQTPTITAAGATRFCEGGSVTLQSSSATGYSWSTGASTQSITVTQPGSYTVTIQGTCSSWASAPVTVAVDASHVTNPVDGSTCQNNAVPVTLSATATGDAYWYDAPTGGNLVGTGASFTTPVLSNTTTYYVESRDTVPGLGGEVGPVNNSIGAGGYLNTSTQYMIFDALKPLVLKTVMVYANSTKSRTFELRNSANTLLQSSTVNVTQGQQTVTLNFNVPVGTTYRLTWTSTTADLYRNTAGANYPYSIANLISITGNSYNQVYWYTFYNWQVEEQPVTCASVRTAVTATVNPSPTATITASGVVTFCDGGSVDLTASAADSYLWSEGSTTQTITATQSGNYSVAVTDINGCIGTSSGTTVTVNPNPIVSISGLNSVYTIDDSPVTITGTPAGGTFSGTGITGNTFDPAAAGVGGPYTVTYTYTDANGCTGSNTFDVSVDLSTTVADIAGLSSVSVTPNPSSGQFELVLKSKNAEHADIAVTSVVGEKIFEERNVAVDKLLKKQIDLSQAAKGFYHLVITTGGKQDSFKLVIQ